MAVRLSRKRLDVCPLDRGGERVWVGAAPPDRDGLAALARRVDAPVMAVIESMTGARFVHDGAGGCSGAWRSWTRGSVACAPPWR